ncbi:hypothetical protein KSP40_PGU022064 [Platanthera guangdongensis]|uniref:Uncharacterized protein n=1 Tax=Platanthera guangdongensis TaxID=2320717 RepID=A0ABR2MWF9_9ASPA
MHKKDLTLTPLLLFMFRLKSAPKEHDTINFSLQFEPLTGGLPIYGRPRAVEADVWPSGGPDHGIPCGGWDPMRDGCCADRVRRSSILRFQPPSPSKQEVQIRYFLSPRRELGVLIAHGVGRGFLQKWARPCHPPSPQHYFAWFSNFFLESPPILPQILHRIPRPAPENSSRETVDLLLRPISRINAFFDSLLGLTSRDFWCRGLPVFYQRLLIQFLLRNTAESHRSTLLKPARSFCSCQRNTVKRNTKMFRGTQWIEQKAYETIEKINHRVININPAGTNQLPKKEQENVGKKKAAAEELSRKRTSRGEALWRISSVEKERRGGDLSPLSALSMDKECYGEETESGSHVIVLTYCRPLNSSRRRSSCCLFLPEKISPPRKALIACSYS